MRGTVVTALKYTISDQPHNIDTALHSCIGEFLSAIGDTDLVSYDNVSWLLIVFIVIRMFAELLS